MKQMSGFSRVIPYYRRYSTQLSNNLLLVVINIICMTLIPLFTRELFKLDPDNWWPYVGWLVALAVVIAGMVICSHRTISIGGKIGAQMETDMRSDLFTHLQRLSFSYYDKTKTGHLMARISNDLGTLSGTLHQLPADVLASILSLVGALSVMFWMNWQLALVALLPLPVAVWLGVRSKHKFKKHSHRIRQEIGQINSTVENAIMGIREAQSFANEEVQMAGFEKVNQRFCEAKCDFAETFARYAAFMIGFMRVHGVLLVIAGSLMYVFSGLSMVDLLAFVMYARFMLAPIERMVNFSGQYAQGVAALERFSEILSIEPEIDSNENAAAPKQVSGDLVFENVTFSYAKSDAPALKDINLTVRSGTVMALVGESGAGKTTFTNLVPRFYALSSGRITLDGSDISELPLHWLRRQIGIVQQTPFLFDDTIGQNIAFGRPDATTEEIIEATRQANLLSFIESLPDGFDTVVGERGVMLSGGQRQRISIARVFLKNPPILILDEATSALDNESERLVQESINRLFKGRTTLIVAHRLSTVKHANLICTFKDGHIVEMGSHEELLAKRGYFHCLHQQGVL